MNRDFSYLRRAGKTGLPEMGLVLYLTAGAWCQAQEVSYFEDFSSIQARDGGNTPGAWLTGLGRLEAGRAMPAYGGLGSAVGAPVTVGVSVRQTTGLVALDLNGDGRSDLIEAAPESPLYVHLNWGGEESLPQLTGTPVTDYPLASPVFAVGDLDGDGHPDLVAGDSSGPVRWFRNSGSLFPFFPSPGIEIPETDGTISALLVGDFDGDGNSDLVIGFGEGALPRIHLNQGGSNPFGNGAGTTIGGQAGIFTGFDAGDLDGDGTLDLVLARLDRPNLAFLNNGTSDPFQFVSGQTISSDVFNTRAIRLGDLDGDGLPDVVVGNDGHPNRYYRNRGGASPFTGSAGVDLDGESNNTVALLVADFDGDGDLDVAEGNTGQRSRLHENQGGASPFANSPPADLSTTSDATTSLALGDLDGDGGLWIVSGNLGSPNQTRRITADPNPFEEQPTATLPPATAEATVLAVADLNLNGHTDLLAAAPLGDHSIILNTGLPQPFDGAAPLAFSDSSRNTSSLAIADVNGDGRPDVVEGIRGAANLLHPGEDSPSLLASTPQPIGDDSHDTSCLALADFNRNGRTDLVAGNDGQRNRLYLNQGGPLPFDGVSGTDAGPDALPTRALIAVDIDRDGDPDLIEASEGGPDLIHFNNGTGSPFLPSMTTALDSQPEATTCLAAADVNRDGSVDILAGYRDRGPRLFLNGGPVELFAAGTPLELFPSTEAAVAVFLRDVNQDGLPDALVLFAGGSGRLWLHDGTDQPFQAGGPIAFATPAENLTTAVLADFTNNGAPDLLTTFENAAATLQANRGHILPWAGVQTSDLPTPGPYASAIGAADLDGDGAPDLIQAGSFTPLVWLRNNRSFQPFADATATEIDETVRSTFSVATGDINQNGHVDLIAGNFNEPNLLYLNNGASDPFAGVTGIPVGSESDLTYQVVLADFDRDGDLDLLAANGFSQPSRLYLNNGTSDPFAGVSPLVLGPEMTDTRAVVIGDVDRDGNLDIILANAGQPSLLLANNGTADPFQGVTGSPITQDSNETDSALLADFDNDGDLDLLLGNSEQKNYLYPNNGTADPFADTAPVELSATARSTQWLGVADIDGDGDLDVIESNFNQQDVIYVNTGGSAPFSGGQVVFLNSNASPGWRLVAAPLTGSGTPDIATANNGSPDQFLGRPRFSARRSLFTSLSIVSTSDPIQSATLTAATSDPPGTSVSFQLSNDGGLRYFEVTPGTPFRFPTPGNDLRWRAEIDSASPARTPLVTEIRIEGATFAGTPLQFWRAYHFDPADLDDPAKEATLWGEDADPDGDGLTNRAEYVGGLSPVDAGETFHLQIQPSVALPDQRVISFFPVLDDRSYSVVGRSTVSAADSTILPLEEENRAGYIGTVIAPTEGNPKGFHRLQITLPQPP